MKVTIDLKRGSVEPLAPILPSDGKLELALLNDGKPSGAAKADFAITDPGLDKVVFAVRDGAVKEGAFPVEIDMSKLPAASPTFLAEVKSGKDSVRLHLRRR